MWIGVWCSQNSLARAKLAESVSDLNFQSRWGSPDRGFQEFTLAGPKEFFISRLFRAVEFTLDGIVGSLLYVHIPIVLPAPRN